MINIEFSSIFFVEITLFFVSIGFLAIEIRTLSSSIRNKLSLMLIGFLTCISGAYFFRFYGIWINNDLVRVYGATFSALFGGLAMVVWGTYMINLKPNRRNLLLIILIIGLFLFILGRNADNYPLIVIGLILALFVFIIIVVAVFKFIFNRSEYIRARQRSLLLMIGFLGFAFLDVLAVYHIGEGNNGLAALLFAFELPFRFILLLAILLPTAVVKFLNKFIK